MSEKILEFTGKEKRRETVSEDISIIARKDSDIILILTLAAKDVKISVKAEENASLVLFYNNQSADLSVTEEAVLEDNASIRTGYSELESGALNRKAIYHLQGKGSRVEIVGGLLCSADMKQDVTCVHEANDTSSNVTVYSLVLEEGTYDSVITGHINKGAKGSKAHQTTRVLTFAEKERCQVLPVLEIDDNDVEASHALSIGQLDEMQLYYLQTRGLNEKEALRLLATGYLMPLANVADDADLRQELTALIERKVAEVCSM